MAGRRQELVHDRRTCKLEELFEFLLNQRFIQLGGFGNPLAERVVFVREIEYDARIVNNRFSFCARTNAVCVFENLLDVRLLHSRNSGWIEILVLCSQVVELAQD